MTLYYEIYGEHRLFANNNDGEYSEKFEEQLCDLNDTGCH
jgi:hypothetical protein